MQSLTRLPIHNTDDNADVCFAPSTIPVNNRDKLMSNPIKILCIEDDEDSCELLDFILSSEGFQVISCATSKEGLLLAKQGCFSAIVLDYCLPEISGVEICHEIRTYDEKTPIIFYTASAYSKEKEAGLAAGANAYLVKPNDFEKLAETVKGFVFLRKSATGK